MGFLKRCIAFMTRPRYSGSGKIWDNTNTPGATGVVTSKGGALLPLVRPRGAGPNPPVLPLPGPEPYLRSGMTIDPFRLHAQGDVLLPEIPVSEPRSSTGFGFVYDDNQQPGSPAQVPTLPQAQKVTGVASPQVRQRDLEYDAGNPSVLRTPQAWTASQRYFDQKQPLPEFTTPAVFSNGVQTLLPMFDRGWAQAFVPDPGMRQDEVGVSPPTLLSKPINVVTNVGSVEGKRSPIKSAKAPKRARSGG